LYISANGLGNAVVPYTLIFSIVAFAVFVEARIDLPETRSGGTGREKVGAVVDVASCVC
jgi:hypothetical protein